MIAWQRTYADLGIRYGPREERDMTHDVPRPDALADAQQAAVDAVEARAEHRISDGCDGDAPAHWLAIQNAAVKQLTAKNATLRAENATLREQLSALGEAAK